MMVGNKNNYISHFLLYLYIKDNIKLRLIDYFLILDQMNGVPGLSNNERVHFHKERNGNRNGLFNKHAYDMDKIFFDIGPEGLDTLPLHLFTQVARRIKIKDLISKKDEYMNALRIVIKKELLTSLVNPKIYVKSSYELLYHINAWLKEMDGRSDFINELITLVGIFQMVLCRGTTFNKPVFKWDKQNEAKTSEEDYLNHETALKEEGHFYSMLLVKSIIHMGVNDRWVDFEERIEVTSKWVYDNVNYDVIHVNQLLSNRRPQRTDGQKDKPLFSILETLNFMYKCVGYNIYNMTTKNGIACQDLESGGSELFKRFLNQSPSFKKKWVKDNVSIICSCYWSNLSTEVSNYTDYKLKELTDDHLFGNETLSCTNVIRYVNLPMQSINSDFDVNIKDGSIQNETLYKARNAQDFMNREYLEYVHNHKKLFNERRTAGNKFQYRRVFVKSTKGLACPFKLNISKDDYLSPPGSLDIKEDPYECYIKERLSYLFLVVGDYRQIIDQIGSGEGKGLSAVEDYLGEMVPKCADVIFGGGTVHNKTIKSYDVVMSEPSDPFNFKPFSKDYLGPYWPYNEIIVPPKLGSLVRLFLNNCVGEKSLIHDYKEPSVEWYASEFCIDRPVLDESTSDKLARLALMVNIKRGGEERKKRIHANYLDKMKDSYNENGYLYAEGNAYNKRLSKIKAMERENAIMECIMVEVEEENTTEWNNLLDFLQIFKKGDDGAESLIYGINEENTKGGDYYQRSCGDGEENLNNYKDAETGVDKEMIQGSHGGEAMDTRIECVGEEGSITCKDQMDVIKILQFEKLLLKLRMSFNSPYQECDIRRPFFNDMGLEILPKKRHEVLLGKIDKERGYYLLVGNLFEYSKRNHGEYYTANGLAIPGWLRGAMGGVIDCEEDRVKYEGVKRLSKDSIHFTNLMDYFTNNIRWNYPNYTKVNKYYMKTPAEWVKDSRKDLLYLGYFLKMYRRSVLRTHVSSLENTKGCISYFRDVWLVENSKNDDVVRSNVIHGIEPFMFMQKIPPKFNPRGGDLTKNGNFIEQTSSDANIYWIYERKGMVQDMSLLDHYVNPNMFLHLRKQLNLYDTKMCRKARQLFVFPGKSKSYDCGINLILSLDDLHDICGAKKIAEMTGDPNFGVCRNKKGFMRLPWWFCECKICLKSLHDLFMVNEYVNGSKMQVYGREELAWFNIRSTRPGSQSFSSHLLAYAHDEIAIDEENDIDSSRDDKGRRKRIMKDFVSKYTVFNEGKNSERYHGLTCAELAIQKNLIKHIRESLLTPDFDFKNDGAREIYTSAVKINIRDAKLDIELEELVWKKTEHFYNTLGNGILFTGGSWDDFFDISMNVDLKSTINLVNHCGEFNSELCNYVGDHCSGIVFSTSENVRAGVKVITINEYLRMKRENYAPTSKVQYSFDSKVDTDDKDIATMFLALYYELNEFTTNEIGSIIGTPNDWKIETMFIYGPEVKKREESKGWWYSRLRDYAEVNKIWKMDKPYNEEVNCKNNYNMTFNYLIFEFFIRVGDILFKILDKIKRTQRMTIEEKTYESLFFISVFLMNHLKFEENKIRSDKIQNIASGLGCGVDSNIEMPSKRSKLNDSIDGIFYRKEHNVDEHVENIRSLRESRYAKIAGEMYAKLELDLLSVCCKTGLKKDGGPLDKMKGSVFDGKSTYHKNRKEGNNKRKLESREDVNDEMATSAKKFKVDESSELDQRNGITSHLLYEIYMHLTLFKSNVSNQQLRGSIFKSDDLRSGLSEKEEDINGNILDLLTNCWYARYEDHDNPYSLRYKKELKTDCELDDMLSLLSNFIQ